jgi:hypothetical protein
MPLAIDLDGVADIFGDLQLNLLPVLVAVAVVLALLLAAALWERLQAPVERIIHKRAGR